MVDHTYVQFDFLPVFFSMYLCISIMKGVYFNQLSNIDVP